MGNPTALIDPNGKGSEMWKMLLEQYTTTSQEKQTGWTENHLHLNEVFGDPNGFNSNIESTIRKYPQINKHDDSYYNHYVPVENVGALAGYRIRLDYNNVNLNKDNAPVLRVFASGKANPVLAPVDWSVKATIQYGDVKYSTSYLHQSSNGDLYQQYPNYQYIGTALLDLPVNPTERVTLTFQITYHYNDSNDRVVNGGGFSVSDTVHFIIYKP
jgi:hypothetical protein